jgi:hypothetical protein
MRLLRSRRINVGLLALLLMGPSICHAWSEYRSENFTVVSDLRPRAAEQALRDLERFRIAAMIVTGLPLRPENTRTQIVMFARSRDFARVRPGDDAVAFYADTWVGPRMVIGARHNSQATRQSLYHEYAHYLLREHSGMRYPMWYDEGFAELLATAEITRNAVVIGRLDRHGYHAYWLNTFGVLPVAELLHPHRSQRRQDLIRFYASAWIFVHYLQLGDDGNDWRAQMRDYVVRLDANQDPVALFEAVFGIKTSEMDAALRAYGRRARYTMLSVHIPEYEQPIERRVLSPAEAAFALGDLAYSIGQWDAAQHFVADVSASDRLAARASSLHAVLEHEQHPDSALERVTAALRGTPDDPVVHANAASIFIAEYLRLVESGEPNPTLITQSIELGLRAKELDPLEMRANVPLWTAYAKLENETEAVRWMMDAYALNRSSIHLNCVIGAYLGAIGRPDLGRQFFENVLDWSHNEVRRGRIQAVLDGDHSPAAADVCSTD